MHQSQIVHEHWSSRFAFLMAAVGSSVGLGNFWRFPYTAGENGGAAFILIYIGCVMLFALPILMAEYAIGRRGGRSAPASMAAIAKQSGASPVWSLAAWVGGLSGYLILSFYCVISAWIVIYIPQTFSGAFAGMSAEAAGAHFGGVISNTGLISLAHAAFVLVNILVVAQGVRKGIEIAVQVLMPLFFLMLVGMVFYAAFVGDLGRAAAFLLTPDFSKVTPATILAAIGQAFFSVGVGAALMMTYGAYLTRDQNITQSSFIVAGSDTLVSIVAGFAIFPLVFAFGLNTAGGPGLFFITLPAAFGQMAFGELVGGLFFTLALFAAFTSSISLLEIGVSWLSEQKGFSRQKAAWLLGGVIWLIGLGHIHYSALLDLFDALTEGLGLPLGGLLIAVFAGWAASRSLMAEELGHSAFAARVWPVLIRVVAPVGIGLVLVFGLIEKAPQIASYASSLISQIAAGGG